jgi:hypothetical protein
MAIKTNLPSLTPRRQEYKREIILPSGGFSNPKAWPAGRLTVFPWDTQTDEYLIENARKANKQQIIYGLLQQLCYLNGASVDDFVSDEIPAILLVARSLSTGGTVAYTSQCPYCNKRTGETIKVPDELERLGEKKPDYVGSDLITLPQSQDVLRIRPLLVKDEKIILDRTDEQRAAISDTSLRLLMPIVSINDSKPDTLEELNTYFHALPPKDARFLTDEERRLTPHLNTVLPHVCDDCGREFKHNLSFDQDFFR